MTLKKRLKEETKEKRGRKKALATIEKVGVEKKHNYKTLMMVPIHAMFLNLN